MSAGERVSYKKIVRGRIVSVLLGIALFIMAFLALILINSQLLVGIGIILIEVLVILKKGIHSNESKKILMECIVFAVASITELLWLITWAYPLYIVAMLLALLLGIYLVVCSTTKLKRNKPKTVGRAIGKVVVSFVSAIAIIIAGFCMFTAINPVPLIKMMQNSFGDSNSFDADAETKQTLLDDGTLYINDIQYGEEYPNSYLDIYISDGDTKERKPTYIFVHGGGFAWGDKMEGDPNSGDTGGLYEYFKCFLDAGYNLISINHALIPEYKYPTPIHQMNEAIEFLQENGENYGIDMTQVIFCGSSAGGQIVGQFVNIQTNPDYAKEIGIPPVIPSENIKAAVFASALLDSERFDNTGGHFFDWLFLHLGRIYFDCNLFEGQENVIQSNVITHTTTNFPPTFISDGNYSTFNDQALDLHNRLDQLGVKNTFNFYERSEAELFHGYEIRGDQYAQDNMVKLLEFLEGIE